MSNVKRYEMVHLTRGHDQDDHELQESPDGEYVEFADYERLRDALEKADKYIRMVGGWYKTRNCEPMAVAVAMQKAHDIITSALTPAAGSLEEAAPKAARKEKDK